MSLKSKSISGVKWGGFSSGFVMLLHFGTLVILSRILSPSDFGLMGLVMVVIGFARVFTDMGISNAIIHHQTIHHTELSSLYWLNIFAGIFIFVVIIASSSLIASFNHESALENLIILASFIYLIAPFGQQFQILFQKELEFRKLTIIDITSSFINSMVTIILVINGYGVVSLIWGQLIGAGIRVVLLFSLTHSKLRPKLYFKFSKITRFISFGLYQIGEKIVNYMNSNLDYILIGSLLGIEQLGYYTLAYNLIIRPAQKINPIITRVGFPVFSKIQDELDKLKKGYFKIIQLLSLVNFPVMVIFAVLSPIFIPIIFGDQWLHSIILVQILSIVGLLRSIGNPIGSLLLAKGRADLGFKWNLSLFIIQVPGLYIGAMLGGAIGVAISFVCLMILYSIFNYTILIKKMLGPCLKEYLLSLVPSSLISLLMGVSMILTNILFVFPNDIVQFTILLIMGMIIFIILLKYKNKSLYMEIKLMFLPSIGTVK